MKVKRLTSEELYHYGIKGQRRGVRRFQNADGSLTYAGKQRYLTGNGTYTHDGSNIKRDPNSFRPTLSYHSTAVNSTGYEARKNEERKKAELGQRTEDKKRASIHASEEAARRRKFYDDNAAQYTAARKKYQSDSEAPEQQYQEWKKKQKEKDHRYTMYADHHEPYYTETQKFVREFKYNEYMKRSEKDIARSNREGEYKKELARQEQNWLSDQKRAEEVKTRSEAYKQEAASIKERSEKRQEEAKKFTSKLKLFGRSFKEVHSENINKGKSKVQSILAKLKR